MNNQAKVIFTSFIYFSLVAEQNDYKISEQLRTLFYKLSKITRMYQKDLNTLLEEINTIIKDKNYHIDYLLASVTLIAEYYQQLKGKKKHFQPMSHKQILELQDELLSIDDTYANDTFEYCEYLTKELLCTETKTMAK